MTYTNTYFFTFILSVLTVLFISHHYAPHSAIKKFSLPPKNVFASSYGDHDVIHRVAYNGLFNFGKRLREADIIIIGNSHAELGISAELISKYLSKKYNRKIKVINMGFGWAEGYPFAKQAIINNHLKCKVLLIDTYYTLNRDLISDVAKPVLKESSITSYIKVLEAWTLLIKDWLFDGYFPRITYLNAKFNFQRYLAYPVGFRRWKDGDVWDYWMPYFGTIYQHTPQNLITYPTLLFSKQKGDSQFVKNILDTDLLNKLKIKVFTTLTPTTDLDFDLFYNPIKELGLPFIQVPYNTAEMYDGYHANANGRRSITENLLKAWISNDTFALAQNLENLSTCHT